MMTEGTPEVSGARIFCKRGQAMKGRNRVLLVCLIGALLLPSGKAAAAEPAGTGETGFTLSEKFAPEKLQQTGWNLVLVNAENPLPDGFYAPLCRLPDGSLVDRRTVSDLNRMLSDCEIAGLHPVICSAYRSRELQKKLYDNRVQRCLDAGYSQAGARKEAARWVAVPGTSEHETGLALDLVSASYQLLNAAQEKTPEQKWLMANSWKYGYILRYPTDKSAVTGIGYEPWHYRYVGKEAAAALHESGQCLEEYEAALQAAAQAAKAAEDSAETTAETAAEVPAATPAQP